MSTQEIELKRSEYIRVTTPLRIFSGIDKIPVQFLDYAADRGTRVHQYCEMYMNDCLFEDPDQDCIEYVQAFISWFDENVEEVVFHEKRLFCDEQELQGCADILCIMKDDKYKRVPCLVDIKTSSKPSKTWALQTAAYKYLCEKNGYNVSNRLVVNVKNDSSFSVIDFDFSEDVQNDTDYLYKRDLDVYLSVLKAHRFFNA